MSPERFQKAGDLYDQALELEPDRRDAFLREACADDEELRREVESLLAAHESAEGFIDQPALEIAAGLFSNQTSGSIEGKKIGNYQVLSLLGEGGMGEVYLAHDLKLRRRVALKILPQQFIQDPVRVKRFEREARAASALNHPNIITIFDIGQFEGAHYIATEFIEGQTMRQRLKASAMPLGEAIDVAVQTASALAAAHEAGIVHRDIKPENVMVRRDGIVKVLDFGLAKLTDPSSPGVDAQAPTLAGFSTETGMVMGTPRYMSPEQARGGKMDARTDIFSLGVMIYEMVTGRAPFAGATTSEVIAAILRDDPPPLTRHAPEAQRELEKIVSRALRKDREGRYQTAEELLNDLNLIKQKMQRVGSSNSKAHDNSLNAHPRPSSYSIRNLVALTVSLLAVIVALISSQVRWITERLEGEHYIATPSPAQGVKSFPRLTEALSRGVTLEMALLPGGEYEMGSNVGEGEDDESPRHKVKVDPFAIGVYEITQAQWKAVMGSDDNPSHFTGNDNLPVDNVSWALAQDFIKALQRKTGQQDYRLPTEKEWEYAARAGSTGKWGFDDGKGGLSDYAWYSRNAASSTQPVGTKAPNKWGLFDMHGNVMELCQDWYDEEAYKPERRNPPQRKYHVVRGGCIVCAESECRVSFRDYDESGPGKHIGFRVARTVMSSEGTKPSIPPSDK